MPEIRFQDLDKFMGELPSKLLRGVRNAAYKIGLHAQSRLMKYPGKPSYPLKWASAKQRRWYFATRLGTKGKPGPGLPYRRLSDPMSQRLMQSWAIERTPDGSIIGSRATYAPMVQSSEMQQPMHEETGWPTDEQVIMEIESSGLIAQVLSAEIKSVLEGFSG
jgi:hypothetical protein